MAQVPPPEDSKDAQGAYSPPGTHSGDMITFDMGPLALGSRQVHLSSFRPRATVVPGLEPPMDIPLNIGL